MATGTFNVSISPLASQPLAKWMLGSRVGSSEDGKSVKSHLPDWWASRPSPLIMLFALLILAVLLLACEASDSTSERNVAEALQDEAAADEVSEALDDGSVARVLQGEDLDRTVSRVLADQPVSKEDSTATAPRAPVVVSPEALAPVSEQVTTAPTSDLVQETSTPSPTPTPTRTPSTMEEQREALVAIYEALGGPGWNTRDRWPIDSNTPMGDWSGVDADDHGNVVGLTIGWNWGAKGQLPGEIGDLSYLRVLNLSGLSEVTGPLPPEIGNLSNLVDLIVGGVTITSTQTQGSGFTGNIPKEIGNISNLQILHITHSRMTGVIPKELGNIKNLKTVYLYNTRLCIPEELQERFGYWNMCRDRPALVAIYEALGGPGWNTRDRWPIDSNTPMGDWSGVDADDHGNVVGLTIGWNWGAKGQLPGEIGDLSYLRVLNLSGLSEVTGPLPPEIGNLSNLVDLIIGGVTITSTQTQGSGFTGNIPKEIGNISNLQILHITHSRMTGVIPKELGNIKNLKTVYLYNTRLCIPEELQERFGYWNMCRDRPALVAIYEALGGPGWNTRDRWPIDSNTPMGDWSGVDADDHGNVVGLTIGWNWGAKGQLPGEIGDLSYLRVLNLSGLSEVTGPLPPEIGNLSNLVDLIIGGVTITSTQTQGSGFTGNIPKEIGNISNLQTLHITHSRMTGVIPKELGNIKNLKTVYLYNTRLCIPEELQERFGYWNMCRDRPALVAIYEALGGPGWNTRDRWPIDSNTPMGDWSGVDADDHGNVVGLTIGWNWGAKGQLPGEIGDLSYLRVLNLSGLSKVTGPLPPEIGNLSNLVDLIIGGVTITSTQTQGSGFTGNIPKEIGNISNLQTLHITGARGVAGCIPVGLRSQLTSYAGSLPYCEPGTTPLVTPPGPTTPAVTPAPRPATSRESSVDRAVLETLHLATGRSLDWGYLLGAMGELDGVTTETIGNEIRVVELNLENMGLAGIVPAAIGDLENLRVLNLSGNQLRGGIPSSLAGLTKLEQIYLRFNNFEGCIPAGPKGNVQHFVAQGTGGHDLNTVNRVNDKLPECGPDTDRAALIKLHRQTQPGGLLGHSWDTTDCNDQYQAPWDVDNAQSDIGTWSGVTVDGNDRVLKLELGCRNLHENIPAEIGMLTQLTHLDLSGNELGGAILPQLDMLINLTHLDLSRNALRGDIEDQNDDHERGIYWANLNKLEYLDLSSNKSCNNRILSLGCRHGLSGSVPNAFGEFPNLKYLNLSYNELGGEVPYILGDSTNLRVLHLGNNAASLEVSDDLGAKLETNDNLNYFNVLVANGKKINKYGWASKLVNFFTQESTGTTGRLLFRVSKGLSTIGNQVGDFALPLDLITLGSNLSDDPNENFDVVLRYLGFDIEDGDGLKLFTRGFGTPEFQDCVLSDRPIAEC